MRIEIVEFYETFRDDKKQLLKGTLHVYLCDEQIDLKGILVSRKGKFWFFDLPYRIDIDSNTGEKVKYPVISFTDQSKMSALIQAIRKQGQKYIENEVYGKCCAK